MQPVTPAVPKDRPGSGLVAGSAAAAVLAVIAALDQFLVAHGELGGLMMAKLGPLLTPIWGLAPLLLLLGVLAWWGGRRWHEGQAARAAEAAAANAAAVGLTVKVGEVADGLAGLRSEVHALRGALQHHADRTDERLRDHDAGLAGLRGQVSSIVVRVDALERPPPPRRRAR